MEDGAIESESLVRPRPLEGNEVDERERDDKRQKVEGLGIDVEKVADEEPTSNGSKHNGGGLLDNLMAKLSSPRTAKPIDVEVYDANNPNDLQVSGGDGGDAGGDVAGGGGDGGDGGANTGGGIFNNLMSNFFHQNGSEAGKDGEEKKETTLEESEITKKAEVESEGATTNTNGSIINNLVPDDVVPASDEASILIHSVVHD